jgi:hypothetical protein
LLGSIIPKPVKMQSAIAIMTKTILEAEENMCIFYKKNCKNAPVIPE